MKEILAAGFEELGLRASPEQLEQLVSFYRLLTERNAVMNLTAISGEEDSARSHFLDSCALLGCAELAGKRVVDVGGGAGFPGVPLRIMEPAMELTELDSQLKRVEFVSESCRLLGLDNVRCLACRAEEAPKELRESFDVAVSRAVARLNVLLELCLPLVRVGGVFIAMKGPGWVREAEEAENAVAELGGGGLRTCEYRLPGTDTVHTAVLVEKLRPTPDRYPRRWAKLTKRPL